MTWLNNEKKLIMSLMHHTSGAEVLKPLHKGCGRTAFAPLANWAYTAIWPGQHLPVDLFLKWIHLPLLPEARVVIAQMLDRCLNGHGLQQGKPLNQGNHT